MAGAAAARWRSTQIGLYRVTDGSRTALAAAGPLNPVEFADVRTTDEKLGAGGAAPSGGGSSGSARQDAGDPPGGARPRRRGHNWMGFAPTAIMS